MAKYLEDFRAGDTVTIRIDYGAVDITGWKFWFTLKSKFDDASPVAQAVTTAGTGGLDDAVNGICYLTMPSDVTKTIPAGKYVYDVQRAIDGSPPDVKTLIPPVADYKDKLEVVDGVTIVDV